LAPSQSGLLFLHPHDSSCHQKGIGTQATLPVVVPHRTATLKDQLRTAVLIFFAPPQKKRRVGGFIPSKNHDAAVSSRPTTESWPSKGWIYLHLLLFLKKKRRIRLRKRKTITGQCLK
jgi:hypothetical protein